MIVVHKRDSRLIFNKRHRHCVDGREFYIFAREEKPRLHNLPGSSRVRTLLQAIVKVFQTNR